MRLFGGLDVWAVPETAVVTTDARASSHNEIFDARAKRVQLAGAINEVVAFQVVFKASGGGPDRIQALKVADFRQGRNVIAGSSVRLYRQIRVLVNDYPAWYLRTTPYLRQSREVPDVLVPLSAPKGALPIELQAGRCEAVWVDVRVPPGAEPGSYAGRLRVEVGAGRTEELELLLTVLPFAIPQTRHLGIIAGLDTASLIRHHLEVGGKPYAPTRLASDDPMYEKATAVVDEAMRLLHEHRCSPVLWDLRPTRRMGVTGQMELDWSDYDRLVAGVLDGSAFEDRAAASAWVMPIDERDPSPDSYGGSGSPEYERFAVEYLRKCAAHFGQRGWLDRHFVWMPVSTASRREQYKAFEQVGRLIRRADPRLRLVCPLAPMSLEPYGYVGDPFVDLSELVGIWCPPPEVADYEVLARQRSAGRRSWLMPGRPPYSGSLSLVAPPENACSIAWQAYRFSYDGVCIPAVNDWPISGRAAPPNSERQLIWPGKPYGLGRPIPSIRLKRILRGSQDYEYLWLLERNRRPAIAKAIASDLFRYGGTDCYAEHFLDSRPAGWVADERAWGLARRLMGRELQAAIAEEASGADRGKPEDVARLEQEIEWSRLIDVVRRMQASVDGVRVRFDLENKVAPVLLEANVSLFNATGKATGGRVNWTDLPKGWQADTRSQAIGPLAPNRGARTIVRARADVIRPNTDGIAEVKLAFQPVEGEPVAFTGRACVLTAQRIAKPPSIDGILNDWPLATNVAGDFVLVGAGDVPKVGRPTPDRPSQVTTVFACNDDQALYIAFNCAESRMDGRRIAKSNYVPYEDLWPVGDDLVEVVLDPTGQAVGPGDLLHIIVKSNGAVIAERGIECLARVALHGSWASGITAAVDDQSQADRWTVEIRIPLTSLGKRGDVMGVNFARFDARRGEYASWTAARSHLYSPATLGNMQLGRQ